ncbi:alpha/beta fold hydrolase [Propioniciclava soli]|uniref:Alpha/beta fold hydrolase n=1 Tax=Propioniciclava soli TaxID=2775081 RepID=A0ABZ3C881_9ACTN
MTPLPRARRARPRSPRTPRGRRTLASALLALTCLATVTVPPLAADAAPTTSARERARVDTVPTPTLAWEPCELGECATVRLPLDYDEPGGASVDIAVTRIPARDQSRRLGSLFLNPGGPGASGAAFPLRATEWLGEEVLDRFDLIGMDPRGTNGSTNTQCFPTVARLDRVTGTLVGMSFPVTEAEEKSFVHAARRLAKSCAGFGKEVASAISTAQVARDMDVLRRAVGDEQLTYLGFSYGTYLGQVYANLFPDRVRAIALDGVVDPTAWVGTDATAQTPMSVRMDSATATSKALTEVLRRCAASEACGVPDPQATFDRVAQRLLAGPVTVADPEGAYDVTYQMFITTVIFSLYSDVGAESVPALAAMLDELQSSDLTRDARVDLSRRYSRTAAASLRRAAGYENTLEQVPAIMCTDSRNPRSPAAWDALANTEDTRAPHVGRYWLWNSVYCAGQLWGAHDEDAYAGPFNTVTAHPLLVVGNLYDPATSYEAARSTARLLPRSRLLTSTNWGHTAYGISPCATAHVDAYLLDGVLPAPGTTCDDAHQPFGR